VALVVREEGAERLLGLDARGRRSLAELRAEVLRERVPVLALLDARPPP